MKDRILSRAQSLLWALIFLSQGAISLQKSHAEGCRIPFVADHAATTLLTTLDKRPRALSVQLLNAHALAAAALFDQGHFDTPYIEAGHILIFKGLGPNHQPAGIALDADDGVVAAATHYVPPQRSWFFRGPPPVKDPGLHYIDTAPAPGSLLDAVVRAAFPNDPIRPDPGPAAPLDTLSSADGLVKIGQPPCTHTPGVTVDGHSISGLTDPDTQVLVVFPGTDHTRLLLGRDREGTFLLNLQGTPTVIRDLPDITPTLTALPFNMVQVGSGNHAWVFDPTTSILLPKRDADAPDYLDHLQDYGGGLLDIPVLRKQWTAVMGDQADMARNGFAQSKVALLDHRFLITQNQTPHPTIAVVVDTKTDSLWVLRQGNQGTLVSGPAYTDNPEAADVLQTMAARF